MKIVSMRWIIVEGSKHFLRHKAFNFLMTKRTHRQGFVFISNHFWLFWLSHNKRHSTHMMTKRVLRAWKIHLYLAVTTRFNAHEWGMFVCKFDADKRHYAVNGNFYENELSLFRAVLPFRCYFLEREKFTRAEIVLLHSEENHEMAVKGFTVSGAAEDECVCVCVLLLKVDASLRRYIKSL